MPRPQTQASAITLSSAGKLLVLSESGGPAAVDSRCDAEGLSSSSIPLVDAPEDSSVALCSAVELK